MSEGTTGTTIEEAPAPPTAELVPGAEPSEKVALKDRLLLPLLTPILSIVAVAVLAINISRVFLATDADIALISAVVITLAILIGAACLSAFPRAKTSSLGMVVVLVFVIAIGGGILSLGPSFDEHQEEAGGYVEPPAPANAELPVEALASIKFNAKEYTVEAGVVEVSYFGATGHTLLFTESQFNGFILRTPPGGKGRVTLEPGEYEIYCNVPGHKALGMDAIVTVVDGPATPAADAGTGDTTATTAAGAGSSPTTSSPTSNTVPGTTIPSN